MGYENVLWKLQGDKVLESINAGKRLDARKFDEYRKIEIRKDISHLAEATTQVKLGNTEVICGIKLEIGVPYPDSPEEGSMSTSVELLPLASPEFESGPPSENAIEIGRVVDRSIREGGCLDFKDLFVEEGKSWIAFIDFYPINYDGNLFDACSIAGMSALLNAKIPKLEDGVIVRGEWKGKLKLKNHAVLNSFAKIGNSIVADPSIAEEKALTSRIHISFNSDGNLNAFQKGGPGSLTANELDQAIDTGLKNSKHLIKIIEESSE
ncbi:MAG TPA: RNA-binding protein [archaeon]|nr:RNA-binding protein [archaeon]